MCFVHYKGWNAKFDEWVSVNNVSTEAEAKAAKQARVAVMPDVPVPRANPAAARVPDPPQPFVAPTVPLIPVCYVANINDLVNTQ
jgi:hypothetical protein